MNAHKLLVILDDNFVNNTDYQRFINAILELFNPSYSVDFNYFKSSDTQYEYDSELCQKFADEESILASILDYDCVIVYGIATYFWLRSYYFDNMIVINPILDIYKEVRILDPEYFDDLKNCREILLAGNTMCILSNELKKERKNYDNVFESSTVIVSEDNISNPEKFFSKDSDFKKTFDFLTAKNN